MWVRSCKIASVILKATFLLIFGLSAALSAQANGLRCEALFLKDVTQPNLSEKKTETSSSEGVKLSQLSGDVLKFEIENRIRKFAEDEMLEMSPKELAELRSEAHKIGKKLLGVEARNDFYKSANGSLRSRIIIEEANNMRRVRNELKRGSIDQAVEGIEFEFVHFEVNYLYMQTLRDEIGQIVNSGKIKSADFENRLSELNNAEKYFGKKFFKYQAMRNMLEEVKKSALPEQKSFALEALHILHDKVRIEAAKQLLGYRNISLIEVERYADFSSVAKDSMNHAKARTELWTAFKLGVVSGPLIKFAKGIVYKMPSKINLKLIGINAEIQPRQAFSEAIGIGYNQHLRDLYLENIESIVELKNVVEQYELLKSLDAVAPKSNELFVAFARVPENQKIWLNIKAHVKSLINQDDAFIDDFYERMQIAEKKAIASGPLPLYYNEAGISVVGKMTTGGFTLYMLIQKYLDSHPEAATDFLSAGQQIIRFLSGQ